MNLMIVIFWNCVPSQSVLSLALMPPAAAASSVSAVRGTANMYGFGFRGVGVRSAESLALSSLSALFARTSAIRDPSASFVNRSQSEIVSFDGFPFLACCAVSRSPNTQTGGAEISANQLTISGIFLPEFEFNSNEATKKEKKQFVTMISRNMNVLLVICVFLVATIQSCKCLAVSD